MARIKINLTHSLVKYSACVYNFMILLLITLKNIYIENRLNFLRQIFVNNDTEINDKKLEVLGKEDLK